MIEKVGVKMNTSSGKKSQFEPVLDVLIGFTSKEPLTTFIGKLVMPHQKC